jgi:hypothetical protein
MVVAQVCSLLPILSQSLLFNNHISPAALLFFSPDAMPSSPQRSNATRNSRSRDANFLGQHGSQKPHGANRTANVD